MPDPLPFLRLSEGASSADGSQVRLHIEARDVAPFDVAMNAETLADIIQYLSYLSSDAAIKRGVAKDVDPGNKQSLAPIPATQLALAPGTPGTALVLVRLFNFDLTFELPIAALQSAAPSFAQIVH